MEHSKSDSESKKIKKDFNRLKEQVDDIIKKLDVSDIDSAGVTEDLKEKIEKSSPHELEIIEKQLGIDRKVDNYIKDIEESGVEIPYNVEPITEEGNEEEEEIREENVDGSFKIKISEDKMSATIDLIPSRGGGKPLNYDLIKKAIEEKGIVYGVNYDLLKNLVESVEKSKEVKMGVIIAQGTSPENGEDGRIEFHFSESDDILLKNSNKNDSRTD